MLSQVAYCISCGLQLEAGTRESSGAKVNTAGPEEKKKM